MLNKLTPTEKLWLYAKQKQKTQQEVLRDLNTTIYHYNMKPPKLAVKEPTQVQWLVIFRKRQGWSAEKVASKLGVTKMYVSYMENGTCSPDRLLEFWSKNVPRIFREVVSKWSLDIDGNRSN